MAVAREREGRGLGAGPGPRGLDGGGARSAAARSAHSQEVARGRRRDASGSDATLPHVVRRSSRGSLRLGLGSSELVYPQ